MSRTNPESGELEMKYVRNVRYMYPKTRQDGVSLKKHPKTKLQVRELFDLTDDADAAVVPQNLCDVIDLDSTEYNLEVPDADDSIVSNFTQQSIAILAKCPFCVIIIGPNRMATHFDNCRGYQQKVVFSFKK